MKTLKTIFLAGKITNNDWRWDILKSDVTLQPLIPGEYPCALHEYAAHEELSFPVKQKAVLSLFDYVGPFYLGCGKYHSGSHGCQGCDCDLNDYNHGCWRQTIKGSIVKCNQRAIDHADIVYAWLDDLTAYATFHEIGYASAKGKEVWIAAPTYYSELALVYESAQMARVPGHYWPEDVPMDSPREALIDILTRRFETPYNPVTVAQSQLSPIEAQFLAAWHKLNPQEQGRSSYLGLFPQYPLASYRLDFAHTETHVAIELDGLEAHQSTSQIAYDRKRQRDIEGRGWKVVRFGGKEIYHDADACAAEARKIVLAQQHKLYTQFLTSQEREATA